MSDSVKQHIDDLQKEIEERSTFIEKERAVKNFRVEKAYEKIKEAQDEIEKFKKLDVTQTKDSYLEKMDREHDLMLESFKKKLPLVVNSLTEKIPFSYPNVIFVGARTGSGKSTFAANVIHKLMKEGKRSLVISNEEMSLNVYNRIICLEKNWNLNAITRFSKDQHDELKRLRSVIYKSGRVNVIDNDFPDFKNATTTLEGIKFILNNLKEKYKKTGQADYDAIIIDYYQKINESKDNPGSEGWSVLSKVSEFIDSFYKEYPAPIMIMGQLKGDTEDGGSDFEYRIKGGKSIHVIATVSLELAPDKGRKCTNVICHKNRWGEDSDINIPLGWDRGRFVEYTPEFQLKISTQRNAEEEKRVIQAALGGSMVDDE